MADPTDLELVEAQPLAWLALLTWQALRPGIYQAHIDAYEEWERQCPEGVSTARVIEELRRRYPDLVHEQRRQG